MNCEEGRPDEEDAMVMSGRVLASRWAIRVHLVSRRSGPFYASGSTVHLPWLKGKLKANLLYIINLTKILVDSLDKLVVFQGRTRLEPDSGQCRPFFL